MGNEWCVENAGWESTHDGAWKEAHLFYIKHLCDFKSSELNNRMKSRFGCNEEIIDNWISFAKECVCDEQYTTDEVESAEIEVEKWLKQIYGLLSLVQNEARNELLNQILDLTKEHCLYPEEINGTVELLYLGETPDNLIQKSIDGDLETTDTFEKRFNIKLILDMDYDKVDEYFNNYRNILEISTGPIEPRF